MVLGMSLRLFTQIHVAISIIAIASGLVVALCLLTKRSMPKITALFLVTTILTSVTGFFFPFHGVTPGIILGVISLAVLTLPVIAFYSKHLAGGWRRTFVISAMVALYLNCFVLVAQSFQKIAALHALAPTGTETAFKAAQLSLLLIVVAFTFGVERNYRPALA